MQSSAGLKCCWFYKDIGSISKDKFCDMLSKTNCSCLMAIKCHSFCIFAVSKEPSTDATTNDQVNTSCFDFAVA